MIADILFFLCVLAGIQTLSYYGQKTKKHRAYTNACKRPAIDRTDIVFKGSRSGLTPEQIHAILLKRFPYYRSLQPVLQQQFVRRLQSFMHKKTFIIKDDEGYKEMPVLVSAAAIQITFGLKNYKLPFYRYIRIYPQEYFADHAFFTVLAGNVKGNIISVAWNQLLNGYRNFGDGSNVGLHEMSHALYIQKMVIEEGYAKDFCRKYRQLEAQCSKAYSIEIKGEKDVYSSYADTNLQEFWAESAELFFEKPAELKTHHPDVFDAMKILLNQDPLRADNPVLKANLPFRDNMKKIFPFLFASFEKHHRA